MVQEGLTVLILITEGEVETVVQFRDHAERAAYAAGFSRGACCYGAGSVYCINWDERKAELSEQQLARAEELGKTPEVFRWD